MTGAVIDLATLGSDVQWPDAQAASDARAAVADSGYGRLGDLFEWLSAASGQFPGQVPRSPFCVVAGPVSDQAREVAAQVDVPIAELTAPDATRALEAGSAAADERVNHGCDLLIVADAGGSLAPALLVSVITGREPVALLPRGAAAVDTEQWIGRAVALRDRRPELTALRDRPGELLDALGEPSLAATAGLIMRAVARRTPVVLDGPGAAAAALLCHDVTPRTGRWWRFADRCADAVTTAVLDEFAAQPLLELGTATSNGVAGLLTLPLLRAAAVGPR